MILCIPTNDDGGVEARISPHFGRAPWFTFVNDMTGDVEVLRNDESRRVHGSCIPTEEILGRGVEGVVCRGIGRGASAKLAASGVAVFLTEEDVASSALVALREGKAIALDGASTCSESRGRC